MSAIDAVQSAFDPRSRDAAAIAELMWVLIVGAVLVFLLVMVLATVALRSRPAWLGRQVTIVLGGIALPSIVLVALLLYSLRIAAALDADRTRMRIEVIGHQWWWQVRYLDDEGKLDFETANEIRLPVGERVQIELVSNDVLHSFWVPSLAGKLDLVPGRRNRMQLSADRAGVFRGQCAEYCGGPHAQMALYVVAEPEGSFERWRSRQREPAAAEDTLFVARCAVCHTIRGTDARGALGPDLTHVGGRLSIGAGILPSNAGTLARWIASSQHIKPGNLMPSFADLRADELSRLAAYLERLD